MNAWQLVVGVVLPPVTALALLVGLGIRLARWWRAPVAKITLFPSARSGSQLWAGVAREVFLFRSLWKADEALWAGAWVFHLALALIAVGHLRVVTDFPLLWAALGLGEGDVDVLSASIGGAVGLVVLATGLYLLVRRLTSAPARDASKAEDYVALALLLAVVATGDAMRFFTHIDLTEARAYFQGLATLDLITMPAHPLFWLHFLLAQVLLLYLPFGKLLHLPGVFFCQPLLRKDY